MKKSQQGPAGSERPQGGKKRKGPESQPFRLQHIPVDLIRPEDGLGRKRDRDGHRDLCRSIEQFGVLTPITVRRAPGKSGQYLLIKGQGRTLACRLLGLEKIPAVVVDDHFAETEKVQQFLVENVARLKMRPIDRALLIANARQEGEETVEVAKRFGVSPATVRRLEAQLDGASSSEVSAIKANDLNLSLHAVITRHVTQSERAAVIRAIGSTKLSAVELESLFVAIGWRELAGLGVAHRAGRIQLLRWACDTLSTLPKGQPKDRLRALALELPMTLPKRNALAKAVDQ